MKTIYEMTADELREIARAKHMRGAWKAKKSDMIAFLEEIGYEPATSESAQDAVEIANDEVIEEKEEAAQNEPETTEEEPATKEEPEKQRGKDFIEWNGKTQNLSQWAKELGMPGQTLFARIHLSGWTVEKAFTTPIKKRNKKEEA